MITRACPRNILIIGEVRWEISSPLSLHCQFLQGKSHIYLNVGFCLLEPLTFWGLPPVYRRCGASRSILSSALRDLKVIWKALSYPEEVCMLVFFCMGAPVVYLEVGLGSTEAEVPLHSWILAVFKVRKRRLWCQSQYFNWIGFIINVSLSEDFCLICLSRPFGRNWRGTEEEQTAPQLAFSKSRCGRAKPFV